MADHTITGAPVRQVVLVGRLRRKQLRRGDSPSAGEIELENITSEAVEIEADRHPLQYLDMVVTDAEGRVVSDGHYGDIFSPLGRIYTLRLAPGEKFSGPVSFVGNVPGDKQLP